MVRAHTSTVARDPIVDRRSTLRKLIAHGDRSSLSPRRRRQRTAALAVAVLASVLCAMPAHASAAGNGLVNLYVHGEYRYVLDIKTNIPAFLYVGCTTPTLTFYKSNGSYWFASVGPQRCGSYHEWKQYRNQIFPDQTKVCATWSGVWGRPCARIFE